MEEEEVRIAIEEYLQRNIEYLDGRYNHIIYSPSQYPYINV